MACGFSRRDVPDILDLSLNREMRLMSACKKTMGWVYSKKRASTWRGLRTFWDATPMPSKDLPEHLRRAMRAFERVHKMLDAPAWGL
jgi:hypothetical protein